MIAGWMAYSIVVGGLLAGVAALLHALRRSSGHAVRWIWVAGIVCTSALTVTAPWRVSSPTGDHGTAALLSIPLPTGVTAGPTLAERVSVQLAEIANAVTAPTRAVLLAATRAPRRAHYAVLLLCTTSALVALLLLTVLYRRALRLRGTWMRTQLQGVPVLVAPLAGPAVIGIAPAEIVVPSWLLDRTPEEQHLVLEHERSHVLAHDPLLLLSAWIAVACMPWNPALWFMLSRLRLAVEMDCDRRVLRSGASTRSYAQLLIELSQHRSFITSAVPAFSHTISHLERRLLAMTARPSRTALPARLGGALIASLALLAACESKLPTSAELDGMDVARATARVVEVARIDTSKTVYLVNGRAATKQEAEAIATARIASIEVVRAASAKTFTEVRIRTATAGQSGDTVTEERVAGVRVQPAIGYKLDPATMSRIGSDTMEAAITFRRNGTAGGVLREVPVGGMRIGGSSASPVRSGFVGLLVVDGVITDYAKLNSISPDRIESVEVLKGASASTLYKEPAAANGVIRIKLKKPL